MCSFGSITVPLIQKQYGNRVTLREQNLSFYIPLLSWTRFLFYAVCLWKDQKLIKNVSPDHQAGIIFKPVLPKGAYGPLARNPSVVVLSQGQGNANQSSWISSFLYLTGHRQSVLVFVFLKNWGLGPQNFLVAGALTKNKQN